MTEKGELETVSVGCTYPANSYDELKNGLPAILDHLFHQVSTKVVPHGPVKINVKATGRHKAIKGKAGNVLEAGYDDDGETWLEVGT